ncbi:hypothetical protein ONS96_014795 [Cadophora gregata f. sp. sojae]|nr:hypothetical protein ONS96_014795 [Cadophora gregata f. sp. sojae]
MIQAIGKTVSTVSGAASGTAVMELYPPDPDEMDSPEKLSPPSASDENWFPKGLGIYPGVGTPNELEIPEELCSLDEPYNLADPFDPPYKPYPPVDSPYKLGPLDE